MTHTKKPAISIAKDIFPILIWTLLSEPLKKFSSSPLYRFNFFVTKDDSFEFYQMNQFKMFSNFRQIKKFNGSNEICQNV